MNSQKQGALKQESDTKIAEEEKTGDDVQATEFVPEELEEGVYQYPSVDLLEENPASAATKT